MNFALSMPRVMKAHLGDSLLLFFLIFGVLILLFITPWGAGLSPDSALYIGAARRLLAGEGLVVPFGADAGAPLTHHAPLYPALLALVGRISGIDPLHVARWLGATLFGVNISLVGALISSLLEGKSQWLPLLGALLAMLSVPLLVIHSMAWSEPLYLSLTFGSLFLLGRYFETRRSRLLILAGVAMGLAFATRYAGIVAIAAGILGLFLLGGERSLRSRVADALVLGIVSLLPMMVWMLRNLIVAGTTANRALAWHPVSAAQAWSALYTVSSWFLLPPGAGAFARIVLVLALALLALVAIVAGVRRRANSQGVRPSLSRCVPDRAWLLFLFLTVYVGFVVLSISILDANIPLDNRILSPVFVAGLVLLMFLAYELLPLAQRVPFARLLWLPVLIYLFAHVEPANGLVAESRTNGIGFTSRAWQQSETIDCARALPDQLTIYTNAPQAIYLYTGRSAQFLPRKVESTTRVANGNYQSELEDVVRLLAQQKGAIVYFSNLNWETFPSAEELGRQFQQIPVFEHDDGLIFVVTDREPGRSIEAGCSVRGQE